MLPRSPRETVNLCRNPSIDSALPAESGLTSGGKETRAAVWSHGQLPGWLSEGPTEEKPASFSAPSC